MDSSFSIQTIEKRSTMWKHGVVVTLLVVGVILAIYLTLEDKNDSDNKKNMKIKDSNKKK